MSPVEQDTIDCEYLVYFEPKKIPKVPYFTAQFFFFQYCQLAQNQTKSHILFHKNGSQRDFYIMTLLLPLNKVPCSSMSVCVLLQSTDIPWYKNLLIEGVQEVCSLFGNTQFTTKQNGSRLNFFDNIFYAFELK